MLDLRRLCDKKGIPYLEEGHHHCHEGWIQIHCPFCAGGQEGWHLGFSLETGAWNCWRCGKHTTSEVLRALSEHHNIGSLSEVYRDFSIKGYPYSYLRKKPLRRRAAAPPGLGPMQEPHRRYLRRRRFNPDRLERLWGLQGTSYLSGQWNWRIVIPIRDEDKNILAYQGRTIGDATPRYLTLGSLGTEGKEKNVLYGIEYAQDDAVLVVEGPTDVWRLGPGAVATLGVGWTPSQANRLRKFRRRYILFDPEPEAQKRARALAKWLSFFPGETEVILGLPTDPGNLSDAFVEKLRHDLQVPIKTRQ